MGLSGSSLVDRKGAVCSQVVRMHAILNVKRHHARLQELVPQACARWGTTCMHTCTSMCQPETHPVPRQSCVFALLAKCLDVLGLGLVLAQRQEQPMNLRQVGLQQTIWMPAVRTPSVLLGCQH